MLHHGNRAAAGNAGAADPYFEYNTLLFTGNGTNGAQNNTFLDSSTNNFTITRNGNTTQGTFSPYGSLWSNYFDGSGDYLSRAFTSTTDGMYLQGTTYTIEAWVYMTSTSGTQVVYSCTATNTSAFGAAVIYINAGVPTYDIRTTTGGSNVIISGGSVVSNTWNHIAVSVSAGSARLFLNGAQVGTTTTVSAATFAPVGGAIGRNANNFTTGITDFTGYISNLRIVQGQALYTANFTPSTTPLTAVSGTSILTCQSNRFIDNSSNNFAITRNGDTKVTRFSPFNPTAPYDTATIGGSGYFDGTGDYLSLASNAAFGFGTGDFTIEGWVYPTKSTVMMVYADDGSTRIGCSIFYVAGQMSFYNGATTTIVSSSGANILVNTWNHIAWVRTSGVLKMFANGVQVYSAAMTTNFGTPTSELLGAGVSASDPNQGYISNVRVVKGTAVYTTGFTPPTSPVTAVSGTSLLCNMTNAGIPDAAMMNNLETVGNAQVSTSVKKYGTGSLKFDGSGDYLKSAPNVPLNFGTGDFTVEGWIYANSFSTTPIVASNEGYTWAIIIDTGGVARYYLSSNGSSWNLASNISMGSAMSTGSWYHFALVRNGSTFTPYINGVAGTTTTSSATIFNGTGIVNVGGQSAGNSLNGYIDDLRITKGLARYTANFTPPTAALPTY